MTQPSGAPLERPSLHRVLNPRTVAVVGLRDGAPRLSVIERSLASGAEFFFVHPKADTVLGQKAFPDLRSVGRPVDAVFTAVGAEATVQIAEQGAELGIGGLITFAAGFAEVGESGAKLQFRMVEAARRGAFPIIGPNGVGMINVPARLDLTMLTNFSRRPGGLSAVTHSGALVESIAACAWRSGGVGLNLLISAGNEAVTDMADYIDYLVDDAKTKVVALVVETIRRPEAFFSAVRRCIEAGKPIVALKLGRSKRSQEMAASHTGALTGDAWVYDVAFRQAGIQVASDMDDLMDRVQFLEQLPSDRWTPVRNLGVMSVSGGSAQLASDLAEVEHLNLPEVPRLRSFVKEHIPGGSVENPLDTTGLVALVSDRFNPVLREYASAPEFDAFLWVGQHAEWDESVGTYLQKIAAVAEGNDKTIIVTPLSGAAGQWLDKYRANKIGIGNGLRGTMRGLATMAAFMRLRPGCAVLPASAVAALPRPAVKPIRVAEGEMLPFAATMDLLAEAGIPIAPYHLIPAAAPVTAPPFAGPYVAKLADVPHRTEYGAVSLKVGAEDLEREVSRLRSLAATHGLPPLVAVQPMASGFGEAFIGIQGASELGPVVAFGMGGVFVELLNRIGGRVAPLIEEDAFELIDEFSDLGIMDGFRGMPAWDRPAIASTLLAAGKLAAAGRDWIASIDINPLIITEAGPCAVDGLCLLR